MNIACVVASSNSYIYVMYKLRFCTSCTSYKEPVQDCLYRISPSNKPNLYNTVVQVACKRDHGYINNFIKKYFLSYVYKYPNQCESVKCIFFFHTINTEFTKTKTLKTLTLKHLTLKIQVFNIFIIIYKVGTLTLNVKLFTLYHAEKNKLLCDFIHINACKTLPLLSSEL